jgi:hypothetical protein
MSRSTLHVPRCDQDGGPHERAALLHLAYDALPLRAEVEVGGSLEPLARQLGVGDAVDAERAPALVRAGDEVPTSSLSARPHGSTSRSMRPPRLT